MKKKIAILAIILLWAGLSARNYLQEQKLEAYNNVPMILQINEQREKAGVGQLIVDPKLADSAMKKACDMEKRHYYEHADPDGIMSWHLIKEEGIEYKKAGENIAQGMTNPREAMVAWMASPTHKENILDPRYTEVGYATCGNYMVQHFVEPKEATK